jgi:hypothetical protein
MHGNTKTPHETGNRGKCHKHESEANVTSKNLKRTRLGSVLLRRTQLIVAKVCLSLGGGSNIRDVNCGQRY